MVLFAPSIVTSESERTPRMKARAAEAPRALPRGRLAGGWVTDLVALGKAVTLCFSCCRKFDAKRHEYHAVRLTETSKFVIGDCDGCRDRLVRCVLYVKQS